MKYPLTDDLLSPEDIEGVVTLLRSGDQLTMSKKVTEFEEAFADHLKVEYAVMVNSGSSANLVSFAAVTNFAANNQIQPGAEVLIPCVCWSTSMWPIIQLGLTPVIVDVNPDTFQIDTEDMKRKKTSKTAVVLLVHIIGDCPNMSDVMRWAIDNDLTVIEDTCESLGTTYKGKHLGTFGRFGTFSFYYSHHITTIEGGMVVCHTQEDADLLRCLRAHGWARNMSTCDELVKASPDVDPRFLFVNVGYNLRSTEINATLGLSQLKRLDAFNLCRKLNFSSISSALKGYQDLTVSTGEEMADVAWFAVPITLSPRVSHRLTEYKAYLTANGVDNRPIVSGNFARQPVLTRLGIVPDPDTLTGAEYIHTHSFYIGLPCIRVLSEDDVKSLVDTLTSFWI